MSASLSLGPGEVALFTTGTLAAGNLTSIPPAEAIQAFKHPPQEPYTVPDARSRPKSPIALSRIYLPLALVIQPSGGAPGVTNALLNLFLMDDLRVFWIHQAQLTPAPLGTGAFQAANALVTEDLFNPIDIAESDSPVLYANASFDRDVLNATVWLGAQVANLNTNTPAVQPGAFFFDFPDQQ